MSGATRTGLYFAPFFVFCDPLVCLLPGVTQMFFIFRLISCFERPTRSPKIGTPRSLHPLRLQTDFPSSCYKGGGSPLRPAGQSPHLCSGFHFIDQLFQCRTYSVPFLLDSFVTALLTESPVGLLALQRVWFQNSFFPPYFLFLLLPVSPSCPHLLC